MNRYRKNLKVEGDNVYSYNTHVATIQGGTLYVLGYWSMSTSTHVNYVAREYGLEVVKGKPPEEENKKDGRRGYGKGFGRKKAEESKEHAGGSMNKTVAGIMMLGDIFGGGTKKGANDWKTRMLKAGLENRGLIMPEDWNTLTEKEKERRLNDAIGCLK